MFATAAPRAAQLPDAQSFWASVALHFVMQPREATSMPIILCQTALGSFLAQLLKVKLPNNSLTAFNTILTPTKPILLRINVCFSIA